jgi:hypothetical protein
VGELRRLCGADIQGQNAQKAGFGIGMGLGYEKWD